MNNHPQQGQRAKSSDIPIPGAEQSKAEDTLFVGSYNTYSSLSLDSYGRGPLERTAIHCTGNNWQEYLKKQLNDRKNSIESPLSK